MFLNTIGHRGMYAAYKRMRLAESDQQYNDAKADFDEMGRHLMHSAQDVDATRADYAHKEKA